MKFTILIEIQRGSTRLDFDSPSSMPDWDYHTLTGLNKSEFHDLISHLKSADVRPSENLLGHLFDKNKDSDGQLYVGSFVYHIKTTGRCKNQTEFTQTVLEIWFLGGFLWGGGVIVPIEKISLIWKRHQATPTMTLSIRL